MIIKIVCDKGLYNENDIYIYCPNNINIKRNNIKSQFKQWSKNLNMEKDKDFFEKHKKDNVFFYNIQDMIIYWINNYLLTNTRSGDKAYVLENTKISKWDYKMNINSSLV